MNPVYLFYISHLYSSSSSPLQPLSDANFKKGFNRLYDWNLARALRRIYSQHHSLFEEEATRGSGKPFNPSLALNAKTIRDFDEAITAVSFDWPSVDDYYAGSSSSMSIPNVAIPLLIVQVNIENESVLNFVCSQILSAGGRGGLLKFLHTGGTRRYL